MGADHPGIFDRWNAVGMPVDGPVDATTLGIKPGYSMGSPFFILVPYAVRTDIALHAVSSSTAGNASDPVDRGYRFVDENNKTGPNPFDASGKLRSAYHPHIVFIRVQSTPPMIVHIKYFLISPTIFLDRP
jgi:hypothetical protein